MMLSGHTHMPALADKEDRAALAVLGGSFNPPHIGHFRIACEVLEQLGPMSVLFVPCAIPVHKPEHNLLPFDLRLELVQAAIQKEPDFAVSGLEGERVGPSYTIDTLRALIRDNPHKKMFFIMGAEDVPTLPTWRQWEDILRLVDIVALPRSPGWSATVFAQAIQDLHRVMRGPKLPHPRQENLPGGGMVCSLNEGRSIYYLWQPVLEISSTLVRERWLNGQNLDFLVPEPVLEQMRIYAERIRSCWMKPPARAE